MSNIAEERIRKVKVGLQSSHPFFAYLSLFLKLKEFNEEECKILKEVGRATMGVDKHSNFYYSPDFVESLTGDNLRTAILHELGHIFLGHVIRGGFRKEESPDGWNISVDACVNSLLLLNGFQFDGELSNGVIPENDILIIGKKPKQIKIKDVSKKVAEEIYDELMKQARDKDMIKQVTYVGFDDHSKHSSGHESSGNKGVEKENRQIEKDWKKRMIEAGEMAKLRGKTPLGMDRYVETLLEEKVNWRAMLQRFVSSEIISDFTWRRRSRKSIASGFYMPSVKKENVDINVVIDLSGSISEQDLRDFLGEIISISNSFKDRVNMKILTHEMGITGEFEVNHANEEKIVDLKMKGGGGTSHKDVWKKLSEARKKVVILLTDGYSDITSSDNPDCPVIWVVSKGGADDKYFPFGNVIRLEE